MGERKGGSHKINDYEVTHREYLRLLEKVGSEQAITEQDLQAVIVCRY